MTATLAAVCSQMMMSLVSDRFVWFGVPLHPLNVSRAFAIALLIVAIALAQKALIISSYAGSYAARTPAGTMDFCVPYLRFILNFLDIQDVEYVEVANQAGSNEVRQHATETAIAQLLELAIIGAIGAASN